MITKVEVADRANNKKYDLNDKGFEFIDFISTIGGKEKELTNLFNYNNVFNTNKLSNSDFEIELKIDKNCDRNILHLLYQDEVYFEFTKNEEHFLLVCSFQEVEKQLNNFTNFTFLKIKYLKKNDFFKVKTYIYETTSDKPTTNVYPLNYNFKYPQEFNDFETGTIIVNNEGDYTANCLIELETSNGVKPEIELLENDKYKYICTYDLIKTGDKLTISSLPINLSIKLDDINIEQYRDIRYNPYFNLDFGKNTFIFKKVLKAKVVLYEYYYNL